VKIINPKPISEIRREKELSQLPTSDAHLLLAEMSAILSDFFDHYFSQFPEQE
jgi:hypothetical protein